MTRATTSTHRGAPKFLNDENVINGYTLALRAAGKADKTVSTYLYSLDQLRKFCAARGMPGLVELTAEHIREYLNDLYKRGCKPAGVSVRYRAISHFFRWMVTEGERTDFPMENVPAPRIPDTLQPHYTNDEIKKVLDQLPPTSHDPMVLRDRALILALLDSGMRGSEVTGLRTDDIDFRELTLTVRKGKGGKERRVGISALTASAIERYHRRRHPSLWLFAARDNGPLTFNAIRNMVRRLFVAAGVEFRGLHSFRRSFALSFLEAGGSPLDLQELGGWTDIKMVQRYTKATQATRALQAHRKYSPVSQLGLQR